MILAFGTAEVALVVSVVSLAASGMSYRRTHGGSVSVEPRLDVDRLAIRVSTTFSGVTSIDTVSIYPVVSAKRVWWRPWAWHVIVAAHPFAEVDFADRTRPPALSPTVVFQWAITEVRVEELPASWVMVVDTNRGPYVSDPQGSQRLAVPANTRSA